MKGLLTRLNGIALPCIAVVMGFFMTFHAAPAYGAPPASSNDPMRLSIVSIPLETLSAATPSNVWYTVTSRNGPFCLEGFIVSPGTSEAIQLPTGTVMIRLVQIDDFGLSHQNFTLFNGTTGGFSPLDIVLSYGNHICANKTIVFQATEFQGLGFGTNITLNGQAVILAEPGKTVKITGSTTQPQ
ncbi:MAG: hypothetical protein ABSD72_12040 [Terracidiphilus sp.]|jgi:hypothetical protein